MQYLHSCAYFLYLHYDNAVCTYICTIYIEIIHKMETMGNHVVELALPILLLLPFRTPRIIGAIAQIFFQGVLILSGNLAFLNWLTALPAVMCFDDAFVAPLFDSDEVELARQTDQDYRFVYLLIYFVFLSCVFPHSSFTSSSYIYYLYI